METLWQDVKYGARMLMKNRGLTMIAILTLALGIGANTAIFSLVNSILLWQMPVRNPEELVILRSGGPRSGMIASDESNADSSWSYPMYKDLRDKNEVFSGLLAMFNVSLSISAQNSTERAAGVLVSGNYFEVLGVKPAAGRLFTQEDDQLPGAHPVVVLSHDFWKRRFGASPQIINQDILVNNQKYSVIGVAQAGFEGLQLGARPDIFVPMNMKAQITPTWNELDNRRAYWLKVIGRLKPGITPEQAEQRILATFRPLLESELPLNRSFTAEVRQRFLSRKITLEDGSHGRQVFQDDAETPLFTLLGMTGLVLLIACANVANLLLARAAARQKEIAVRLALGAGRGRIARQLLTEGVLLAVSGAVIGLLVAIWTRDALLSLIPEAELPGLNPTLDGTVLGFNFALAILTGILFSLAPALQATRPQLSSTLKDQIGSVAGGLGQARFRKWLVVAQVSFTLLLAICSGLFARSLSNLRSEKLGLTTDGILQFSVSPAQNGYSTERTQAFLGQLQEALETLPSVLSVSAAQEPLLANSNSTSNITVEGRQNQEDDLHVWQNTITPHHFRTLGIRLLAGRDFAAQDSAKSPKVVIINDKMAREVFGQRNPLGLKLAWGSGRAPDMEIVGVVSDSKHSSVRSKVQYFVYSPNTQDARLGSATFYVRTATEPAAITSAIRREVQRLDANLPLFDVKTMAAQVEENIFADKLMAFLATAFGGLAALLAAIGIYGVMAYTVARRTKEIGIRMALGAGQGHVSGMVLKEVGHMAAIGIAIGLPSALALSRVFGALLFGLDASDVLVIGLATAVIAAVALLAGYFPARKATRIDPMVALRYE